MSKLEEEPDKSRIIIDLNVSQNANLFTENIDHSLHPIRVTDNIETNLLQRKALKTLSGIIGELAKKAKRVESAKQRDDQWAYLRSHDVITIDGPRGSGKTTFILNFLHLISNEDWRKDEEISCDIQSLRIIDPTLIEGKEHIFLTVIGRIVEVVNLNWESDRAKSGRSDEVDAGYQRWRACLSSLSRGLCILGKKTDLDGDRWADPQFIMQEGLENASQGDELERHFHSFVRESLRLLHKDAFIMALDDVDTRVETGWPVLEVLRKYLTTPQIIVILSGDIELYTKLIFNQQCAQMKVDKTKILEDGKVSDEYKSIVNNLTEQYMLKIMRPGNRIEMQTVFQTVAMYNKEKKEVLVRYIDGTLEPVESTLKKFCKEIYGSEFQTDYLARVLMDVPTRSCIQILYTATKFLAKVRQSTGMGQEYIDAVADLGHVFQNALSLVHIPIKLVYEADHVATIGPLTVTLADHDMLKLGRYLFPSFEKDSQRQVMMVLGAVYARVLSKQPGQLFTYFVNMCLTANLQELLPPDEFKRYVDIAQLRTEPETVNSVKRGIKFLIEKVPSGPYTQYCTFRLENAPLQVTSWRRYIVNMASVYAKAADGSTHRYVSFYALLGAIATMLESVKSKDDGKSVTKTMQQYGSETSMAFDKSADMNGNEPGGKKQSGPLDANKGKKTDEPDGEKPLDPFVVFGHMLAQWCWSAAEKPMTLLVLAEAWNRFTNSIKELDEKYNLKGEDEGRENESSKSIKIGNYIQYCIIILLNHLFEYERFIRDSEEKIPHDDNYNEFSDIEHIITRFNRNVEHYSRYKDKYWIFGFLFSCPVWMHFWNYNDGDLKDVISKYRDALKCQIEKSVCGDSSTDALDKRVDSDASTKTDWYENLDKLTEWTKKIANCKMKTEPVVTEEENSPAADGSLTGHGEKTEPVVTEEENSLFDILNGCKALRFKSLDKERGEGSPRPQFHANFSGLVSWSPINSMKSKAIEQSQGQSESPSYGNENRSTS